MPDALFPVAAKPAPMGLASLSQDCELGPVHLRRWAPSNPCRASLQQPKARILADSILRQRFGLHLFMCDVFGLLISSDQFKDPKPVAHEQGVCRQDCFKHSGPWGYVVDWRTQRHIGGMQVHLSSTVSQKDHNLNQAEFCNPPSF